MIVDLPAREFCSVPGIGELTGVDFPALQASFRMMRFEECRVLLHATFPIAAGQWTCKEMFQRFAASKYDFCYTAEYFDRLQTQTDIDHEGLFVLGGSTNYWHLFVDALANLPLLNYFRKRPLPQVLVYADLHPDTAKVIERICSFIEINPPRLVVATKETPKLINSFVPCVTSLHARCMFLRHFGRSVQAGDNETHAERIFFRRGDVRQRRILNEDELEEKLKNKFGFVAVDPGSMPILEQIKAMRNARVMVGGHGAALTNLCFAADGNTHLIELFTRYPQPFFKQACECLGIEHHLISGIAVSNEPLGWRADNANYTIDIEEVLRQVGAIVG